MLQVGRSLLPVSFVPVQAVQVDPKDLNFEFGELFHHVLSRIITY